jgi:hypothetical protein
MWSPDTNHFTEDTYSSEGETTVAVILIRESTRPTYILDRVIFLQDVSAYGRQNIFLQDFPPS